LLENDVDLAVHSLKDLPTQRVPGLQLSTVPPRADVRDVLIARNQAKLEELPTGARIGTGSARRRAFLMLRRNDLTMLEIRGNVDTRLAKLDAGEYDAIVLALAGLERLGWANRATEILPTDWMLPAVGQGALGIETRTDDPELLAALAPLDHPPTHAAVIAERTLLAELRAGCLAPVGAWARLGEDSAQLVMTAAVAATDGSRKVDVNGSGSISEPEALGRQLAQQILGLGGAEIIAAERSA
jgi:hydroxymethylbilane synthase